MTEKTTQTELLTLTAEIVSAYLMNNQVTSDQLSGIIHQVFNGLNTCTGGPNGSILPKTPPKPAVPIEESITDEYIVCLEDGKKLQMLKRHLKTVYNMSVEEYRERWALGADYPVVAPNYARRRSQIAREAGLGLTGRRPRNKPANTIETRKEAV